MKNSKTLQETVIKNNYCIGCGACEFVQPDKYQVKLSKYGMYNAEVKDENILTDLNTQKVCPFSDSAENENYIAEKIYNSDEHEHDTSIGNFLSNYAGYVDEGEFREKGSSGGFGKWLLTELLETDYVDYVIQVEPNKKNGELFTYSIFSKGDDLLVGSKSAYYPVTMVDGLNFIKKNKGRYAITALPCFSKAIRLLCLQDDILNSRVKFVLGVICGHLKSTGFAESLAWQVGVEPNKLEHIEFRGKIEGKRANEKGIYAIDSNNQKSKVVSSRSLIGGDWGHGLFKYKACDYCDDVVGETTDVSIGDAWLDDYINDSKGANVVIIRNKIINDIVKKAINTSRLKLDAISKEKVIKSQSAGIRHRREGLSYRLYLKQKEGSWAPKKRVEPKKINESQRRNIYKIREKLSANSHKYFLQAKHQNDLKVFETKISKEIETYKSFYLPFWKRKIRNILIKLRILNLIKRFKK